MEYFFAISIVALGIWMSIVAAKGSLTNNTRKHWFKKFTKRGRWMLLYGITLIVLNLCQFIYNLRQDEKKAEKIANEVQKGIDSAMKIRDASLAYAFKKQGIQISNFGDTLISSSNDIHNSVSTVIEIQEKIRESANLLTKNNSHLYQNSLISDSLQTAYNQNSLINKHLTITNICIKLQNEQTSNDPRAILEKTREAYIEVSKLINDELGNPVLNKNNSLKKIWRDCSNDLASISDDILYERSYTHTYVRGLLVRVLYLFSRSIQDYLDRKNQFPVNDEKN